MPYREWLRKAFPHLAEPALGEVQRHVRTLRYRAGETVVRQGDSADRFYIIRTGEVSVSLRDETGREALLATLGPGQFFGEMGLLEATPRTASVHAKTDLGVLALDREAFRGLVGPADGGAWEGAWRDAVRSACHTLVRARGVIQSIDLTGERWAGADPGRLLRLTGLSRRAATEHGLQVRVSYTDDRPVLHIAARPQP